ncbi:MAG TPA: hypothetical protein VF773_11555 [Verrucomicrobiae bacterium]
MHEHGRGNGGDDQELAIPTMTAVLMRKTAVPTEYLRQRRQRADFHSSKMIIAITAEVRMSQLSCAKSMTANAAKGGASASAQICLSLGVTKNGKSGPDEEWWSQERGCLQIGCCSCPGSFSGLGWIDRHNLFGQGGPVEVTQCCEAAYFFFGSQRK